MRIQIDHLTRYHYTLPMRSVIQLLRVTPQTSAQQTVVSWDINIDCDARITPFTDCYGNRCHLMAIDHSVADLSIEVTGLVDTWPSAGIVDSSEPLPELVFLQPTMLTEADEAIRTFARDVAGDPAKSALDRCHALMGTLWREISFDTRATSSLTDAASAFADRRGVCQDLAHIFIAACRSLKIPARYVSGHLLRQDGSEWQEAAHAWAEAHVPGLGWVSFDPANGISADEHYIRVAVGLDYRDAAPVSGARYGGGFETLSVDLRVRRPGQDRAKQGQAQGNANQ
jgi:transglutaminase-like putative cysteine protease